jgi:hypothetical protein
MLATLIAGPPKRSVPSEQKFSLSIQKTIPRLHNSRLQFKTFLRQNYMEYKTVLRRGKPTLQLDAQLTCYCRCACLPGRHVVQLLAPALWQAYVDIFTEIGMEVYEGIAAVLVEEQAPSDADKVVKVGFLNGLFTYFYRQIVQYNPF